MHYESRQLVLKYPPPCEICQDIVHLLLLLYDSFLDMTVPDDLPQDLNQSGFWWKQLLAGGVAGAVSRTCTAPLDRIKIYLQVHGSTTMKKCFNHMNKEGGICSFWRGNGLNVTKIAPESSLKFFFYENIKARIRQKTKKNELAIYERFMAGSVAGAMSQTIIYPLEVLKTRLALRKTGEYSSIIDAIKKICKREGIMAFYKGYVPNILGIVPYAGIDLAIYETLKTKYMKRYANRSDQPPSAFILLGCGTVSSTAGQAVSYPLSLVRTKLQAEGTGAETMSSIIRTIIKQEGFFGLYRGFGVNFLKVIPSVGISYIVYEKMRFVLGLQFT